MTIERKRIRSTAQFRNPEDQEASDELMRNVAKRIAVGTAAPGSTTPGVLYAMIDSTDTTAAVTLYAKYNDEWYGG